MPAVPPPPNRAAARCLVLALAAAGCGPTRIVDELPDVGDEQEVGVREAQSGAPDGPGWPLLVEGDTNRNVAAAQLLLRFHGEALGADGLFGPGTRSAAIRFQRRRGLTADGRIGEATWRALLDGATAQAGDVGAHVQALEYLLRFRSGYPLAADGRFESGTEDAVRDFQGRSCLAKNGVVGPGTWAALVARIAPCGGGPAATLLAHHRARALLLEGPDGEGASPLDNITDAARGLAALRSGRGHFGATRVFLNRRLLDGMVSLERQVGFYAVTSIAGGLHGPGSFHYYGDAVDIAELKGVVIRGDSAAARALMRACVALGASEVIGPSWAVPGARSDANHQDHVHCGGWR